MDATGWILFTVASALALAGALWLYRRREVPGRGRLPLALLRWAAVTLVLLLLFDPVIRVSGMPVARRPHVLLDASVSMTMPAEAGGESAWARASREAAGLAEGRPVVLFGVSAGAVSADSLPLLAPREAATRLLPALQAAAEAGASRVVVLTDGRIADAAAVRRWLPGLGLDLDLRIVGDTTLANLGLEEVEAPRWTQAGEPAEIRFGVAAAGPPGDSIRVGLYRAGQPVATAMVAWPRTGRIAGGVLRFTPEAAPDDAPVHYEIAIEGEDASPADDRRSAYIRVSDRPVGVVLLSLKPDWEPRFLLPTLGQALGVPVQGFLSTRTGFVRSAAGLDAGVRMDESDVRAAVAAADLLVLHGIDAATPEWVLEAGRAAPRLLVLPAGMIEGLGVPTDIAGFMAAEWYPSADVPPSPVAALLAGIDVAEAPPLSGLSRIDMPAGGWAPLHATRGRRGEPLPLLVAGETNGRRWAVATAEGYWRWAFRGGSARDLYDRLWSSVTGWLVREQAAVATASVWPVSQVLEAGEPVRWVAAGLAADSLLVRMEPEGGGDAIEGRADLRGDTAVLSPVPAGRYRYTVSAVAGDSTLTTASGELAVDAYSGDYALPRVSADDLRTGAVALGAEMRRGGRPVHTLPWLYLLLVALIATEWILRRRWGLR